MPGSITPKNSIIEERDGDHLSARSGDQTSSTFRLSIVSGLNVVCLVFISYHFAFHPSEAELVPDRNSMMGNIEIPKVPELPQTNAATLPDDLGNVELVRASRQVVSIASGFDLMEGERASRQESASLTSANSEDSDGARTAGADEHFGHWVQLGALSKKATAQRYWSGLKLRHKSILHKREPRYFGPMEVGGSLYHIRLGPMASDAAAGLCERLEADGADCFCVRPPGDVDS